MLLDFKLLYQQELDYQVRNNFLFFLPLACSLAEDLREELRQVDENENEHF